MRRLLATIVFILVAAVVSCQSSKKSSLTDGHWAGRMQNMSTHLRELMPYVYSTSEFRDGDNSSKISGLIKNFSESVEVVPQHMGESIMGKDPLLKYSLDSLQSNVDLALKAYNEGHKEFSRGTLKAAMSSCFNCHSSTDLGPEQSFHTDQLSNQFRMFATEKADYYVATRQYDRALNVLEKLIETPKSFYDSPHEQSLALKKYLSLQVRVKKDKARTLKVLEAFLARGNLPYYLVSDVESWVQSVKEWSGDKSVANPEALARKLIQGARRKQKSQGYHAGLVEHLRATALLHEALRSQKSDKTRSNHYFSLGTSYEVLSELGLWDLPDVYFEACIRTSPKTKLARKCYRSFERGIVLGFSGSAGIFIPTEERQRLKELKALAGM